MNTAYAKISDPETSWIAGEKFKSAGNHKRHYQLITETMININAPATSAEIAAACEELDRWQIARRLPEMEQLGIVERCDPVKCSVVGSRCVTWAIRTLKAA